MTGLEADDRSDTFVPHRFEEQIIDLGEVRMNYATVGSADLPALLLVPGQSESWWGYEDALELLGTHFQTFAVDLRGQGRSTWTPGRYTLDNMGNDLVRFIDAVIGRPTIVSGNSSGGVLAAWLAAYSRPDQIRAAVLEDPPLFASEVNPSCGHSIRQSLGPMFALWNKWLGDQWTVGDWEGMQSAMLKELPQEILLGLRHMLTRTDEEPDGPPGPLEDPPQNLREYDPEWARAFWTGQATAACDHARMLSRARTPMLLTHHFHAIHEPTGRLLGAVSDEQVARARELVTAAGQPFEYRSLPTMTHAMHGQDAALFTQTLVDWSSTLESAA
jgi:pimeloyl-ACP methyl ester carboxylesterase